MTNEPEPEPAPPPGPPPPQPPSVLGSVMFRILAPPIAIGAAFSAAMLIRGRAWQDPIALVAAVVLLAGLGNIAHVSAQIVSRPSEPPLGLPRWLSVALLFGAITLLSLVLFVTAWLGGCSCLRNLGYKF